jgi:hypothetical protein
LSDVSLQDIAAVAEIIGVLTIVSGLAFGIFQLRAHRIQQRNAVATSLAKTFYNTEFAKSVVLLHQLPDGASADEINDASPEFREAAVVVCTSFETMGLLVYRRIAPFDLVMDLAGGMSRSMYRKLQNWILDRRENQDQPSWAEWFEWLANLADQYKDEQTLSRGEVARWRPR